MLDFIEKPKLKDTPSKMACLGRYLLTNDIFEYLEKQGAGVGGEIQLADSILAMIKSGEGVGAYKFKGKRYDIGSKLGLLKANIEFGIRNEETAEGLKEYLETIYNG